MLYIQTSSSCCSLYTLYLIMIPPSLSSPTYPSFCHWLCVCYYQKYNCDITNSFNCHNTIAFIYDIFRYTTECASLCLQTTNCNFYYLVNSTDTCTMSTGSKIIAPKSNPFNVYVDLTFPGKRVVDSWKKCKSGLNSSALHFLEIWVFIFLIK